MPATSRAQQRLAAMALHNPGKVRKANRGILGMSRDDLRHFAETPRKELPEHKPKSRWRRDWM